MLVHYRTGSGAQKVLDVKLSLRSHKCGSLCLIEKHGSFKKCFFSDGTATPEVSQQGDLLEMIVDPTDVLCVPSFTVLEPCLGLKQARLGCVWDIIVQAVWS